jgi:hypothetical protein
MECRTLVREVVGQFTRPVAPHKCRPATDPKTRHAMTGCIRIQFMQEQLKRALFNGLHPSLPLLEKFVRL